VADGINGTFQGYLEGTVSGRTFNPAGCATADCSTTSSLIAATFGPTAAFTCLSGAPATCSFGFEYALGDEGLIFHHWEDRNDKTGTEEFRGDIATS